VSIIHEKLFCRIFQKKKRKVIVTLTHKESESWEQIRYWVHPKKKSISTFEELTIRSLKIPFKELTFSMQDLKIYPEKKNQFDWYGGRGLKPENHWRSGVYLRGRHQNWSQWAKNRNWYRRAAKHTIFIPHPPSPKQWRTWPQN